MRRVLSQLAATSEHDHRLDGDIDKTLELGYKAMGSYLVDFRQFTNAWNERPDDDFPIDWDTRYGRKEGHPVCHAPFREKPTTPPPS